MKLFKIIFFLVLINLISIKGNASIINYEISSKYNKIFSKNILPDKDIELYQKIFISQVSCNWKIANKYIFRLNNQILMGHVLAQRYLHPKCYRSNFFELASWLERYNDHPQARKIYRLAIKRMPDNYKIMLGAAGDLQIYHDASNSYIDESGTGSLRIRSNRLRLEKHTGENMVECLEDGAVELYHNGTKRFETTATGVTAPGIISSSVGKSHIGEFTGNGTIAANQASIIQLQDCFSSAYSIYRIVGELGGDQSAEDVGKLRFLTSGTTSHDSGYYWGNLGIDDAGNRQLAADANQASFQWSKNLASSVSVHVDMHIYFGGIGGRIGILGRATYHDQGSDRGFMDFGGQSEGITSATGIEFFCTDGGNLAGYNFSVYGYRTQQGATGKMTGSYS